MMPAVDLFDLTAALARPAEVEDELTAFLRIAEEREARKSRTLSAFVAKYRDDFPGFCRCLDILTKDAKRVPLELSSIQLRYAAARTSRDVILKPRQVGITTEEQARDIWHFLSVPGARVVLVCQSITGNGPTRELSGRFDIMFEALRRHVDFRFKSESKTEWILEETDAKLTIVEAGASVASAAKKGRSGTITRLHTTEVAFWEHAGETLNAMLECVPVASTGSEVVFESTPNGAGADDIDDPKSANGRDTFYRMWQAISKGESEYKGHFIRWLDEPTYSIALEPGETIEPKTPREEQATRAGATPEQLKWYRQKVENKGQDQVDQEYPTDDITCWLTSGRSFFDREQTERLLMAAKEPLRVLDGDVDGAHCSLRILAEPDEDSEYVLAVDTSEGGGGDRGAGMMFQRGTGRHVATLFGQLKPHDLACASARAGIIYGGAVIVVERNNHGHSVLRALDAEQHYPNIYSGSDDKPGWLTTSASRPAALDAFEDAHRKGEFTTTDRLVIGEIRTFVVKNGKPQSANGAHDDLVMSAVIGWDVLSRTIPVDYTSHKYQVGSSRGRGRR
jgi:hypothetical protein